MSIHHEIVFNSRLNRIFDALTKSEQFSELTEAPATIDAQAGGLFSCFGGMITGVSLEIIANKRIVQAWRVGNWDEGVYSIIKLEFVELNESETRLIFDHWGFPQEHREHLDSGWHERYWEPLKKYLQT